MGNCANPTRQGVKEKSFHDPHNLLQWRLSVGNTILWAVKQLTQHECPVLDEFSSWNSPQTGQYLEFIIENTFVQSFPYSPPWPNTSTNSIILAQTAIGIRSQLLDTNTNLLVASNMTFRLWDFKKKAWEKGNYPEVGSKGKYYFIPWESPFIKAQHLLLTTLKCKV